MKALKSDHCTACETSLNLAGGVGQSLRCSILHCMESWF